MQPTPLHIPRSYPNSGSPKRSTGGVCRRPHYPCYSPSIFAFLSPSFDLLPLRTVTVQTGQKLLFDRTSKELWPNPNPAKVTYQNYGVQVPTTISPAIVLLGDGGLASENVTVGYTIQPQGATPAGYQALSAQVDLFDGSGTWVGYLVGDATQGTGTAVFSYGTVFNPAKKYYAQAVLNRGSAIEIRGDKVQVQTLAVDLDIDSDNNAGTQADGTHNAPSRNPLEEQVEDLIGFPGKVISPNLKDVDNDHIPGFADGIDLYGNSGTHASAPFTPLFLELGGSALDPAKAKISFLYTGSNPALVQKSTVEGKDLYTPASGTLRIWSKDGPESRNPAGLEGGGDYLTPGEPYTLSQLGSKQPDGSWKFYAEGIVPGLSSGDQRIAIQIDPDGDEPLPFMEADAVRSSVILAGLVPDYNHNREIDAEDKERAQRGDTFFFWINDDDDSGETGGNDIPGDHSLPGELDCENNKVDGVRDLIDFFPVAFDIESLVDIFPPSAFSYHLKSADENLKVVFPELTTVTVKNYLVDVDTARAVALKPSFPVPRDKWPNSGAYNIEARRSLEALITSAAEQDAQPVILLEGVKPGQAPLVLEISDSAENQVFTTSLNLSLDKVEQMFRHVNLIEAAGGPPPGKYGGVINRVGEPMNLPDSENEADKNFVFVHGYNINGQQARGFFSEMFKRLYWSGSRDKFWGVSWFGFESQGWKPGAGHFTPDFQANVQNALHTAKLFNDSLLPLLVAGETTIAAHSLGNAVLAGLFSDHEGWRNSQAKIKKVHMIDAAIALETLDENIDTDVNMYHPEWWNFDLNQSHYDEKLWASNWFRLFPPDDARSTLTWRNRFGRFAGLCQSETIICNNFYSSGEEVLATHTDPGILWDPDPSYLEGLNGGIYAFALQERLKGRMLLPWLNYLRQGVYGSNELEMRAVYIAGSPYGGWGLNPSYDVPSDPENPVANNEHMPASEAAQLPDGLLKEQPFFKTDQAIASLFLPGSGGSDYAASHRDELLARIIPALTLPVGGPGGAQMKKIIYINNVTNMQGLQVNKPNSQIKEWPVDRTRDNDTNWKHGDLEDVAYPFVKNLFDRLTEDGSAVQ